MSRKIQNPYQKQMVFDKERIALEFAPAVKHIANKLAARLPAGIQVDDLYQVGMIGLLEATDKFDPKRGVKFKTFAEYRIKGAMLDELRAKDWIPRSVRENSTKLETAFTELRSENIDHPTDKQIADKLGLNLKELPKFIDKARPIPLLSLENLGGNQGSEEDLDILETLSDPEDQNQIDKLVDEETQEMVRKAIDDLPEKEQLVLSLYYNEDLNLKEIGAVLDLTESRVSQLRTKAIAMLRSHLREYINS